jgi:hypothetical protein
MEAPYSILPFISCPRNLFIKAPPCAHLMKYHNNSVSKGTLARHIHHNKRAQKTINQQKIVQKGNGGIRGPVDSFATDPFGFQHLPGN